MKSLTANNLTRAPFVANERRSDGNFVSFSITKKTPHFLHTAFSKPTFCFFNCKSNFNYEKVKIMLLSLALLAVVGGALAFKAKLGGDRPFCSVTASYDLQKPEWGFYCAFGTKQNGQTTTDLGSVIVAQTATCTDYLEGYTTVNGAGNQLVCYTETQGATDVTGCQQLSCPIKVQTIAHD